MDGKECRELASHRVRLRVLIALVLLGGLSLPILAYTFGAYIITRAGAGTEPHHLLGSQALLIFTALLVASVGGFLIWRTVTSLARTTQVEARLEDLDEALADRLEESSPVMNSVTRMLTTIERQSTELNQWDTWRVMRRSAELRKSC